MDAEKRSRPEKIQVARKGHVHGKGHNHAEMAQKKENSRRRGETGKQAAWLDWRGQRGVRLIAPQTFDFEEFPARAAKKFYKLPIKLLPIMLTDMIKEDSTESSR